MGLLDTILGQLSQNGFVPGSMLTDAPSSGYLPPDQISTPPQDPFGNSVGGPAPGVPMPRPRPYVPGTIGGAPGAPGTAATPATQPTGKAYLDNLPVAMRTIVEKVANYEINPSTLSTKGGQREKIMAAASQYNPDFDAALAPARFAAIKEFNSGGGNSPAGTITAGNTAIQHLKAISDASQKIGGTDNGWILNGVINKGNAALQNAKNNPDMIEYNNALGRFAEEATKFYRGIGGSEADIQRALHDVTAAQSPEARNRAIAVQADLMQSKINALQDRWKQATGPTGWNKIAKDFPIIQGKSSAALDSIMERDGRPKYSKPSAEPGAASPDAGTLPKISSPAEAKKLPSGTRFVDPTGVVRVVP
jgi:hypothetical protein